jgi:hypothetical protein
MGIGSMETDEPKESSPPTGQSWKSAVGTDRRRVAALGDQGFLGAEVAGGLLVAGSGSGFSPYLPRTRA